MERIIHNMLFNRSRVRAFLMALLLIPLCQELLHAQTSEVYNDAGIRLRVWFNGAWSDANCDETLYPSLFGLVDDNVKYVFEDIKVRASNGTTFLGDQMPAQNLLNLFPINMTFRVKGDKVSRFYHPEHPEFRMLNPWYPYQAASMNITNQRVVNANVSRYAPPVLGATISPAIGGPNRVGLDNTTGSSGNRNILLFDRNFSQSAPDRFQWYVGGMWESDADIDEEEAGLVMCKGAFGLPQVADISLGNSHINPLLNLMILSELGLGYITEFLLRTGGCMNIFGLGTPDPNSWWGIGINLLITDYDDSYASKKNWDINPAFFRATPAGQIGYFATDKIRATSNVTSSEEGYLMLFSYQWDWLNGYPDLAYPAQQSTQQQVQARMCPTQVYTDVSDVGNIKLDAWIDGLFQDNDHEGTDEFFFEGLLGCSDMSRIGQMSSWLVGTEEVRLRGQAWNAQLGQGPHYSAYFPTIGWDQDKPGWRNISPSTSGAHILDRTFTSVHSGMSEFSFRLEAWESDCGTAAPSTCSRCLYGLFDDCCVIPEVFGWCAHRGTTGASDWDKQVESPDITINWRNSPPFTNNYYYVPLRLGTDVDRRNYIAKIRYRWEIAPPEVVSTTGPYDRILCPNEATHLSAVARHATFYQWQYVVQEDPAGPDCPNIPDSEWIDVPSGTGNCPDYTVPGNFTETRIYRLKVFNRLGPGSVSPNGEKFEYGYSQCIRIKRLPEEIPLYSNLACGTAADPTKIRSGSVYSFRADTAVFFYPGITFSWAANNGATLSNTTGVNTTVTFPNTANQTVRVDMRTIYSAVCPTVPDTIQSCYFITEDGGCDTLTGVIYVSPTADGSGIGTITNPFSLANAFIYLENDPRIKHVKMLAGTYSIGSDAGVYPAYNRTDNALIITEGLVVEGGYIEETSPDGVVWVKSSMARSTINSEINEVIQSDSIRHRIGFRAIGVDSFTIKDIIINTGIAPDRDSSAHGYGRGYSNYGILIHDANGFLLQNVESNAVRAGRGSGGITPSGGAFNMTTRAQDANPTNPGFPGNQSGYGTITDAARQAGDGGIAGSVGGAGGGSDPICLPNGSGGLLTMAGRDGIGGSAGAPASGSGLGLNETHLPSMTGPYFIPSDRAGTTGSNGCGGGGGAGYSGGRGGAGGVGGRGGLGGYGGGGAFNLWITGGSTGRYINLNTSNTIPDAVSAYGSGGYGGSGEVGQTGGNGHGNGGRGGNGGNGGRGPAGGHGHAQQRWVGGGSTFIPDPASNNVYAPIVTSEYSSGCTNSIFEISKPGNANNWTATGTQNVHDITATSGSTTAQNASPKLIYYPETVPLGPKHLTTTGGLYQNQIYLRYYRSMPDITVPTEICSGTPIDLLSTPNSDFHVEYEWKIQRGTNSLGSAPVTASTPVISTLVSQNEYGVILPANTTGNIITYQVKYSVKDACCGWSAPLYAYIDVLPETRNVVSIDAAPNQRDTVYVCLNGTVPLLQNTDPVSLQIRPPNPVYQWYVSENGGAYTPIGGAIAETYNATGYTANAGDYRFVRFVGSSTSTCTPDTSNVLYVVVRSRIEDNIISDPLPTVCVNGKYASRTTAVTNSSSTGVNLGYTAGSMPSGMGNTYWYKWETGYRIGGYDTSIILSPFDTVPPFDQFDTILTPKVSWHSNPSPTPSGEGGTSLNTQNLDLGLNIPANSFEFGAAPQIFFRPEPYQGEIFLRRIVGLSATEPLCRDTSNVVIAEVPYGATEWGLCPAVPGSVAVNLSQCNSRLADVGTSISTFIRGGYGAGVCVIQAPDTVCFGEVVNLVVPSSRFTAATRGKGDVYAWYSVPGGPYNSIQNGTTNFCRAGSTVTCLNPLLDSLCSTPPGGFPKPSASETEFLGTYYIQPFDTIIGSDTIRYTHGGMTLQQPMLRNMTFYVNIFDECFSDAHFRANPQHNYYNANPITSILHSSNRWQRKTVIVREPIYIDSIYTDPYHYCSDNIPASINVTVRGTRGNSGTYELYKGDTLPSSLIHSQNTETALSPGPGRGFVYTDMVPPLETTTYYARLVNVCDTTDFVSVQVIVDSAMVDPDDLLGPNSICAGESATLTVDGGSLPSGAEWVLYSNSFSNRIGSNTTGIFSVTPGATTTYIVRGENTNPGYVCPFTDTVRHTIEVIDDCVCETNPGVIEYAPTGTTTIATIECIADDGWSYFANVAEPNVYLFAIEKRPGLSYPGRPAEPGGNTSNFTATVYLTVTSNPTSPGDAFFAQDVASCEANFVMPRYWNVTVNSGSINGFVRTRFYFPPAELAATRGAAGLWRDTYDGTCGLPLVVGPNQVFKNTDATHFNPGAVSSGLVTPPTDVLPTTVNDYRYIGHLLSNLPPVGLGTQLGRNYVEVAWDGFSGGGLAVRVSPDLDVLPVTLLYFTGTLIEDKVHLNWETASELNNDYFVVERSGDTKNWTVIGSVKGNGTTDIPHQYSLIDAQPLNGENYYRLRQVDFDGTGSYSRIILIDVNQKSVAAGNTFEIHPNPTHGPIVATITSSINQQVNMRILDATGRLMGNKDITLGKGVNNVKVDLSKYPAATYILSFTDKDGIEYNAKAIKQ